MKTQKKISTEVIDKIIDLYKTDSIDTISGKLGVSRHVVNKLLKEAGIELRSTGARKGCYKGKKI